jgi:hypothetical protein
MHYTRKFWPSLWKIAHRCLCRALALLAVLSALGGRPVIAQTPCTVDPAESAVVRSILVEMSSFDVPAGQPVTLRWRRTAPMPEHTRLLLIVSAPESARFAGRWSPVKSQYGIEDYLGPGFTALAPSARAPYGIDFAKNRSRILVPLHAVRAAMGEVDMAPWRAGTHELQWAIFKVDSRCTPVQVAAGSLPPLVVGPGAPTVTVQDYFTLEDELRAAELDQAKRPSAVLLARSGGYRLHIYDGRYRVFDTTGTKIVDRAGWNARFSPTSRFVVATTGDPTQVMPSLEVVDLASGEVVRRATGPVVGWSHADSFLITGQLHYSGVSLAPVLVDTIVFGSGDDRTVVGDIALGFGCNTCTGWESTQFRIMLDQGLVAAQGPTGAKIVELATSNVHQIEDAFTAADAAKGLEQTFRQLTGVSGFKLAKGWQSDSGIALTHTGPSCQRDMEECTNPIRQASILVAHEQLKNLDVQTARARQAALGARPRALWSRRSFQPDAGGVGFRTRLNELLDPYGTGFTGATPITSVMPPPSKPGFSGFSRAYPDSLRRSIVATAPKFAEIYKPCASAESDDCDSIVYGAWDLSSAGIKGWVVQHAKFNPTTTGAQDAGIHVLLNGEARLLKEIDGIVSQFWTTNRYPAQVWVSEGRFLIIAHRGLAQAAIIDTISAKRFALPRIEQPELLVSLSLSIDRRLVLQHNADDQFFIYARETGEHLLSGRYVDDEIVVWDREGVYQSSFEGAHFVYLRFAGTDGSATFHQYAARLHKPDRISAILTTAHASTVSMGPIAAPPRVEIGRAAGRGDAGYVVTARSDRGLAKLRVFLDGHAVEERDISGTETRETVMLDHPGRRRWLTAIALDRDGFVSQPASISLSPSGAATGRLLGVLVAVDTYDDPTISKLDYARSDATKMARALAANPAGYYVDVRLTTLADHEATPAAVLDAIARAVANGTHEDTLIVFYAGHGTQDSSGYYLTASTTERSRLTQTALAWQRVAEVLDKARARVIVVLDACHAGRSGADLLGSNDDAVRGLLASSRRPLVVLSAAKGRQESLEDGEFGGGLFTDAVARVISRDRARFDSNGNGVIELSELYAGVKSLVTSASRGAQTPWLARQDFIGDVVLF